MIEESTPEKNAALISQLQSRSAKSQTNLKNLMNKLEQKIGLVGDKMAR